MSACLNTGTTRSLRKASKRREDPQWLCSKLMAVPVSIYQQLSSSSVFITVYNRFITTEVGSLKYYSVSPRGCASSSD